MNRFEDKSESYASVETRMQADHVNRYAQLHGECAYYDRIRVEQSLLLNRTIKLRERCKIGGKRWTEHGEAIEKLRQQIYTARCNYDRVDSERRTFDYKLESAEGYHYAARAWEFGMNLAKYRAENGTLTFGR